MPSEPLYTYEEATAEPAERRITRTLAETFQAGWDNRRKSDQISEAS